MMEEDMGFKKVFEIETALPVNLEMLEDTFGILEAEIEKQTSLKLISSLFFEGFSVSYLGALRIAGEDLYLYKTSLKNRRYKNSILEVEFYFSTNSEAIYQVMYGFLLEKDFPIISNL